MSAAAAEVVMSQFQPRWLPAYVGVGSNLADPRAQVTRALEALGRLSGCRLVVRSPLYRTQPLGEVVQPAFVNAVAGLLTQLSPEELLAALRGLERELGREASRQRWGPRLIDLDLLVMGCETRSTGTLTLPHPGIAGRDFVLYPLADIAPDLEVPKLGRVAALRDHVVNRGIERL
jgi:2-amino-4-hydroxy-6-hydroxymethyldihydropteridine diphosphokinase